MEENCEEHYTEDELREIADLGIESLREDPDTSVCTTDELEVGASRINKRKMDEVWKDATSEIGNDVADLMGEIWELSGNKGKLPRGHLVKYSLFLAQCTKHVIEAVAGALEEGYRAGICDGYDDMTKIVSNFMDSFDEGEMCEPEGVKNAIRAVNDEFQQENGTGMTITYKPLEEK